MDVKTPRLVMVALAVVAVVACRSAPTPPIDETPTTHRLADGTYFAWLEGLAEDGLVVDVAEMLTGEEARQAAIEAGFISEGEDLPNDFFIINPDDAVEVVPLSPEATYRLLLFAQGVPTETEVDYAEFAAVLSGETVDVYGVADGELPATIVVAGGVIVSVTQVYLP